MDCRFIDFCLLPPEIQAAWVQAVGSVGAIIVAVLIPTIGSCLRTRRELKRERSMARAHAVHITKEIDSIKADLKGVVRQISDFDRKALSRLATAHFGNLPNGGGLTRGRTSGDRLDIAAAATNAKQISAFFKVSERMRATAPMLAMLPKVGEPLLTVIVSLDQLYESTERALEEFADDSFKTDPFVSIKNRTERAIGLVDQVRSELLKLFPDALR